VLFDVIHHKTSTCQFRALLVGAEVDSTDEGDGVDGPRVVVILDDFVTDAFLVVRPLFEGLGGDCGLVGEEIGVKVGCREVLAWIHWIRW
jgi:hypothetical protein